MRGITDPEFQKVGGMNSCYCTINSFYGGMNLGTGWNEFILGWNEFIILMDAYTADGFCSSSQEEEGAKMHLPVSQ